MLLDSIYNSVLKPLFFKKDPEEAHSMLKKSLQRVSYVPFALDIFGHYCNYKSKRLHQKLWNIQFDNPIGLAAGFDKTGELYPYLSKLGFGSIEVGTITGEEQAGNPKPRIFRYPEESALVNRMGFNNPGSEKAFAILSNQKKTIPRGINAGKTKVVPDDKTIEDYTKTFSKLCKLNDYAVINISSPNTPGLRNFQEKDKFIQLINGIKNNLGGNFIIPTLVKLSPDLEDSAVLELLDIILDLKLDGVILTNTTINSKVITKYPSVEQGGISGKPLKERSTHLIRLAYSKLKGRIPIIGVGGIDSGESALEKIKAGANLIQIYTSYIYKGPFLPYQILEYLDNYLEKNKLQSISEIVGTP